MRLKEERWRIYIPARLSFERELKRAVALQMIFTIFSMGIHLCSNGVKRMTGRTRINWKERNNAYLLFLFVFFFKLYLFDSLDSLLLP